ncbi:MAG: DNA polymerase III subunit delta [Steroidobacteraceae bacterium]
MAQRARAPPRARAQRGGQARLLADRVEGNLLAAHQELEKLRLLADGRTLGADEVRAHPVADSATLRRVFQLGEAVLVGDAPRAMRVLDGLRGEGIEPTLVLWALARELRMLWALRLADSGAAGALEPPSHAAALQKARRRLPRFPVARLNARALRADRMIKGRLAGSPWDEMLLLAAEFCGLRPAPLPAARGGL